MRKIRLVGGVLLAIVVVFVVYKIVEYEQTQQPLTFYGNVDIREVTLGFRVPGRLDKMLFEEGDFVETGKVMAQLEQDTYLEDLAMAKSQSLEAQAAFDNAKRVYNRRSNLIKTGAVSQALYDQAEASYSQLQAQVKTTEVRIDKAKTALNDTYIKSPTAGYILTRVREPGSIVAAGQTVYTLTVADPVWVRAFIDEPQLGKIYPGQKVEVYTDTSPDKPYHGHIGYIASQAEFTPKTVETTQLRTDLVYRFRIVVDNPDKHLRQGMPVTVTISLDQDKGNG